MSPVAFDTLAFARRLEGAGVPQAQAEAHAEALAAAMGEHMVTRADLRAALEPLATRADLEGFATRADLEAFATRADLERFATRADFEKVENCLEKVETRLTDLERRIDVGLSSLETRLTVRFGGIVVAGIGAATALARLL